MKDSMGNDSGFYCSLYPFQTLNPLNPESPTLKPENPNCSCGSKEEPASQHGEVSSPELAAAL